MPEARAVVEHSSLSNFRAIRIKHCKYDFTVNLASKSIEAFGELHLTVQEPTTELVLDTRSLDIVSVSNLSRVDSPEGTAASSLPPASSHLKFSLGQTHKALGEALTIELGETVQPGDEPRVGIHFKVSAQSTAVQFLEPSQTAGGEHPYLFTQCQAIHARSLVPCQDTPNVKMTYEASVTVPEPLTALMSAKTLPADPRPVPSRFAASLPTPSATYAFSQAVPIPSYLLALAVGQLESREIGPISRVWAEPSVVEAAAYEFAEVLSYLEAGIALAGPYEWGQYDLLLLPPSFPYGGMENPCLTFVTPTLLTGDRSATNVVAHEIAHSWTGNLVTNATWEHFWLNEGWTVFMERKILGRVFGPETEQFHAQKGLMSLQAEVAGFGEEHNFTALVPSLEGGIDPDDAFSRIPYEKGFYFLYYLQSVVGGAQPFEAFMKAYIQAFKLKTCTTDEFREFFCSHFQACEAIHSIDWDTWLFKTGMPPAVNEYDTSLSIAADGLATRWHTADVLRLGTGTPEDTAATEFASWPPDLVTAFLQRLAQFAARAPLHCATTRRMHAIYGLDSMRNPEVRCKWLQLCIPAEDETVLVDALAFAREQGRMKFVRPLYKALAGSKMGKVAAVEQFERVRAMYHPICEKMVASDLGLL